MSAYPHATSRYLLWCAGADGSSHPARKKACAGRGSRPLRLDREDSGSSSGGQVEPPKRSRASRGKQAYQSVLELNQADFRAWRSAFNYDEPQDSDIDNCFWSPQMEKLHRDLYSQMSDLKKVCPHRVIDFDALSKKAAYFGGAVQVVDVLGLRHLMTSQCNYNVPLIKQVLFHRGV